MTEKTNPQVGSRWQDQAHGDDYRVISLVHDGRNVWVHYARESDGKEYSCWVESFIERFREIRNA